MSIPVLPSHGHWCVLVTCRNHTRWIPIFHSSWSSGHICDVEDLFSWTIPVFPPVTVIGPYLRRGRSPFPDNTGFTPCHGQLGIRIKRRIHSWWIPVFPCYDHWDIIMTRRAHSWWITVFPVTDIKTYSWREESLFQDRNGFPPSQSLRYSTTHRIAFRSQYRFSLNVLHTHQCHGHCGTLVTHRLSFPGQNCAWVRILKS